MQHQQTHVNHATRKLGNQIPTSLPTISSYTTSKHQSTKLIRNLFMIFIKFWVSRAAHIYDLRISPLIYFVAKALLIITRRICMKHNIPARKCQSHPSLHTPHYRLLLYVSSASNQISLTILRTCHMLGTGPSSENLTISCKNALDTSHIAQIMYF